ncbi:integrase catalytic domain-containing protein [Trichonephila clavipes]|nr:integrase catalytic domain-containing protein [Trichonephila clavipes]
MADPLFLKENKKSWVLIFTCAVYRAVHFELVTATTTEAVLMAFQRFVSRRGRCSTVYRDNGTNFGGAANALRLLDWKQVERQGAVNAIERKFNPLTAAWWGGWWERLIRILKNLPRRELGRASLKYEEMLTVLADCESIINASPLTYITESEAIKPISPSMFLQDIQEYKLQDIDAVDSKSHTKRIKYRQNLIKDLRERFRSEFLGTLMQQVQKRQPRIKVSIWDIVLVGADNKKHINWPLGFISQLILGRGEVRLVRVQTLTNELLRPIQRLYPLEIATSRASLPYTAGLQWYWARTRDKASHDPMPIPLGYRGQIATSDGPQYLKSIKSMDHSKESDQFNDTAILKHTPKFSKSGVSE